MLTVYTCIFCYAMLVIASLSSHCILSVHAKPLEAEEIIGGLLTKPGEIKYVVSIQYKEQPREEYLPICTGGILSKRFILTAAHCIIDKYTYTFGSGFFSIVANENDLKAKNSSGIRKSVVEIYIPESYDRSCTICKAKGDIAVLKLNSSLDIYNNDNLQRLYLPPVIDKEPHVNSIYNFYMATVAGFGTDQIRVSFDAKSKKLKTKASNSHRLHKAMVVVLDNESCREFYLKVYSSNICAAVRNHGPYVHQGTCQGDSGAPLVIDDNIVIGVNILGPDVCDNNGIPNLYTRVSSYVQFIRNVINGLEHNMRVKKADENGIFD